uniref:Gypsy retrotransposon integrase-like protein 1 n=1 Tax=Paramormyrops kingsleyae TaxID=1676925 RepID=A0A3B3TFN7_9TELE
MEIDTGAAISIISEAVYKKTFAHVPLEGSNVTLKTYTGQAIPVKGQFTVRVTYGDQSADLPLVVVQGNGPSLCGRNWLKKIKLDWKTIKRVSQNAKMPAPKALSEVLERYSHVFQDELGTLKDIRAVISVKPNAIPKFHKARPLPFAMKARVERELERLEKENIISPIKHSEWAAPVVPVVKRDGTIRLCGDYKVTVNQATNADVYPLPRIEEVLATLSGGKLFSKIDLASAYQQVLLDEDSKKYTTINTQKGLFVYNRLCFGVNSAVSIFQRIMENLMKNLNVVVYLDDLLVMGKDEAQHLKNLDNVLRRLQKHGLRVKKSKCEFGKTQVEYLGHVLDGKGVYPSKDKVRAIHEAPAPTDVKELRAFLGLVNYYGRFVPRQSTVLSPLYRLLKEQTTWKWGKPEQDSFNKCKELLTSDKVLVHYDPNLPLTLACDASAYGIGAVIQHTAPNGEERPIAYASRTLSPAEKKYSQIEKEALSLVYGVKKFHQYLWGRQFNLVTDHRPLLTLFGENKGLPTMAAARIQRWAIILSAYDYHIVYQQSGKHGNADGLSRVPLSETTDAGTETMSAYIDALICEHLEGVPLTAKQIARATRKDKELSRLYRYIMEGWPREIPDEMKVYHRKRDELSVEQGCVLWGTRVVTPMRLRTAVLREIHGGHPGIVRMKSNARQYVWWPSIDSHIEKVCKECETCQLEQHMPRSAPLHPWEFPGDVWKRLHIDFAGPFLGGMFMVVVDAFSKWLEVYRMAHATSTATITRLKRLFAAYGVPEQIVTDNATTFMSDEFQQFVRRNGILHTTGAPRHPARNGLAERYVSTFKTGMKKLMREDLSMEDKISHFLLWYRTTPNSTTGESPADLFLKRHVRTRLDFLKPSIGETVRRKQYRQKEEHDRHATE